MAAKMASCGCGSPRGTALRSVLFGAWMACLSLAVVMATFARAEEGQNDINGMDMLMERSSPATAQALLRAEKEVEKAAAEVEKAEKLSKILKVAGAGGLGASAISLAAALGLGKRDISQAKQEGGSLPEDFAHSKKTKAAAALGALLFLGGGAAAITSLVMEFTKGKKLRKELEVATQKSAALKDSLMESLVDSEATDSAYDAAYDHVA